MSDKPKERAMAWVMLVLWAITLLVGWAYIHKPVAVPCEKPKANPWEAPAPANPGVTPGKVYQPYNRG